MLSGQIVLFKAAAAFRVSTHKIGAKNNDFVTAVTTAEPLVRFCLTVLRLVRLSQSRQSSVSLSAKIPFVHLLSHPPNMLYLYFFKQQVITICKIHPHNEPADEFCLGHRGQFTLYNRLCFLFFCELQPEE